MCVVVAFASHVWARTATAEVLLSATENAYNPVPSPDASLIAYVRTGWGRPSGTGGFGRSNLVSEVMLMSADGRAASGGPLADAFLYGWTSDGKNIVCFRDGEYSIVSTGGEVLASGRRRLWSDASDVSERVAFLSSEGAALWVQNYYTDIKRVRLSRSSESMTRNFVRSVIRSPSEDVVKLPFHLNGDEMIVPSPDERYLALVRTQPRGEVQRLWVYDRRNSSWADLGAITIHPDESWNYVNASWNPWFADSARLVFLSASGIVVSTPDGKTRLTVHRPKQSAGLVVPSPDGGLIAYATFEPRPMKMRADLKFWGGSTVWVVAVAPNSKPRALTTRDRDTTYSIHWLGNQQLVFDRVADELFYSKARLWRVEVTR